MLLGRKWKGRNEREPHQVSALFADDKQATNIIAAKASALRNETASGAVYLTQRCVGGGGGVGGVAGGEVGRRLVGDYHTFWKVRSRLYQSRFFVATGSLCRLHRYLQD